MIVVENGTVWSGKEGDSPSNKTIVIDSPIIKHIFPQDKTVDLPGDAERIDASSKFILPGLIDCHTHICFDGSPDPVSSILHDGVPRVSIKAAESAKGMLMQGITTIRDLGGMRGIDIALRDAIRDGIITGPRMLVSGEVLCMTGGHLNFMGYEVDGADEARKGVRRQLKSKVDLIKVMATGGVLTQETNPGIPQLTTAEMRVIVEEAEKAGKRVACHAHGNKGISNALNAGVHTIEHCTYLDDKTVDTMVERNVYYTPTVVSLKRIAERGGEAGIPDFVLERAREMIKRRIKSLHLAHKKGANIVIGTDSGTPVNPHDGLIEELVIIGKECMTTEEVLLSATSLAAKALGMENRLGTLEEGMIADLIIIDGNPLDDIRALRRISAIIKDGQKVFVSER
jgi:imidazolonepropionase-like amidohydrolase